MFMICLGKEVCILHFLLLLIEQMEIQVPLFYTKCIKCVYHCADMKCNASCETLLRRQGRLGGMCQLASHALPRASSRRSNLTQTIPLDQDQVPVAGTTPLLHVALLPRAHRWGSPPLPLCQGCNLGANLGAMRSGAEQRKPCSGSLAGEWAPPGRMKGTEGLPPGEYANNTTSQSVRLLVLLFASCSFTGGVVWQGLRAHASRLDLTQGTSR